MPDPAATDASVAAAAVILYITYDGLTDPLGRSQVLPYLVGCAARGHPIHVLSCEKPDRFARDRQTIDAICKEAGIRWHPIAYHKAPPVLSTVYDLAQLRSNAARLHRSYGIGLVHCRSYIPARAGLALKTRFGVPLLFDMRGFWPEEKTEGGSWNLANPLFRSVFRYFKQLESNLLQRSDGIVCLTEAARLELLRRPELAGRADAITIIPCCADFDHFPLASYAVREAARAELGIDSETPLLVYLGSLGGNYMLGEMLDFFAEYRRRKPGAKFLLITHGDPGAIRCEAALRGLAPDDVLVQPASRDEVPQFLAAGDVGIAFKQPSFSAAGCSPTKLGEMLATGLPLVANAGVGDVAEILAKTGCGASVENFDRDSYRAALDEVSRNSITAEQRRNRAMAFFDVQLAIESYDRLYRRYSAG